MKFGMPKCYFLHVTSFMLADFISQVHAHEYQLEHCTLKTVNKKITYIT